MASQGNAFADPGRSSTLSDHPTAGREADGPELNTKLRHLVESGRSRLSEWRGGFEDGVREKPIRSLLIAAGVGTVIGLLLARRTR